MTDEKMYTFDIFKELTMKETERLDNIADLLNLAFSNVFDAQLNLEMLDPGKFEKLFHIIDTIKEKLNEADIYICGCIEDSDTTSAEMEKEEETCSDFYPNADDHGMVDVSDYPYTN